MINVFICEDEKNDRLKLNDIIETHINFMEYANIKYQFATGDPNLLIEHIKDNPGTGLYFLDINLNNAMYSGISLAEEIRKHDSRGFIVFVTAEPNLLVKTLEHKVEPLDYIYKDIDINNISEKIIKCIAYAHEKYTTGNRDKPGYSFKAFGKMYFIPHDEIICFKTVPVSPRKVEIQFKYGQMTYYDKMETIEAALPNPPFLRCHKSFIINTEAIADVKKNISEVIMINNKSCLVSAVNKKKDKEAC